MDNLCRPLLILVLAVAVASAAPPTATTPPGEIPPSIRDFAEEAAREFGRPGSEAAAFLVAGMPERDLRSLSREFLMENLRLAFRARRSFPWSQQVPEELFLDCVLPYAQLDEPRDPWRPELFELCGEIVKDCKTAGEAARKINGTLFARLGVKYGTGRKRANQSPKESIEQGLASCTGLSIILADACRSVGIPARVAGTAMWTTKRGNHTWVEVWDGDWHYTGAAEPAAEGLDHAWFSGDAAKAVADDPVHAIWAASWRPGKGHFPLAWNPADRSVAAVNVTDRYAPPAARTPESGSNAPTVHLRVVDEAGQRVAARVEVWSADGKFLESAMTRAGTSDLNDMPAVRLRRATDHVVRVVRDEQARDFPFAATEAADSTCDLVWSKGRPVEAGPGMQVLWKWLCLPAEGEPAPIPPGPLTRAEAAAAVDLVWDRWRAWQSPGRASELEEKTIVVGDTKMRFLSRVFGDPPAGGRSLWISMHGGGGAPRQVNDSQWQNQVRLYEPAEGIYIAPRAPTDSWNLWHEGHIDELFDRLIGDHVLLAGVDPDRVYLMGYSAGGDGVYQLAPRMADRFAAASMMAGHPNDASPLGLRNLPFAIFSGENDAAYNRNKVAAEWGAKLDALASQDPGGYPHRLTIYPGLGHWMERKDAEAIPWMARFARDPWPKRVVWHQSGRLHDRFYWLALPAGVAARGLTIRAEVDANAVAIDAPGVSKVILRLHDRLVDLDRPVQVRLNGRTAFEGTVARQADAILESLRQRSDPRSAATALLEVAQE